MPITSQSGTKKPALGRASKRGIMTKLQAKKEATHLVCSNKLSPDRHKLIEYLAVAGCLTTNQIKERLGIGLRTLQRCFYDSKTGKGHILDYHRGNAELTEKYGHTFSIANGLRHIRVWTLGILGREIAKELGYRPVSYSGFAIRQLTHDLLCNAIIFRLIDKATEYGYEWEWLGKNEARLTENKKAVIEPDALLTFTRDGKRSMYCVELHNERGTKRASDKYKKYLALQRGNKYQEWGVDYVPSILAFGHTKAVMQGYASAMSYAPMNQVYVYCRTINSVLNSDSPHEAVDVRHYRDNATTDRAFDPSISVDYQWVYTITPPKKPMQEKIDMEKVTED